MQKCCLILTQEFIIDKNFVFLLFKKGEKGERGDLGPMGLPVSANQ